MRSLYLGIAGAACVLGSAGAALAQPTIGATPLATIPVGALEATPTGIGADGTTLYVAGFSERRILKITGAVTATSATVEVFARTSSADSPAGPITWPGSRGLQNLKVGPGGIILASGDQGTNGAILRYTSDGTLTGGVYDSTQVGTGPRRITAADFYGAGYIFAEPTTLLVGVTPDLAALSNFKSLTKNYNRSLAVVGDDIFVTVAENVAGQQERIAKLSGGTAGQVDDKTETTPWFTLDGPIGSSVRTGVNAWNYNGTDYLIVCNPSFGKIHFINAATGADALTLTTASHGIGSPSSATVVENGSAKYLAVSTLSIGGGGGRVDIYSIDGSTIDSAVSDWSMY